MIALGVPLEWAGDLLMMLALASQVLPMCKQETLRDVSLKVAFAIGLLGIFSFCDPPGINGLLEDLSLVVCLAIIFDPLVDFYLGIFMGRFGHGPF